MLALSGLVSFQTLPLILLCVAGGALLILSLCIFIGSLAFYVAEAEGWVNQILHVFLSLADKPGSIYSGALKAFLLFVFPAGVISILPIELLRAPSAGAWALMLGLPLAFFAVSVAFFYRGLRRYESGNRFGVRA